MRKGLIIALAAVLVLGLSGAAMSWTVDVWVGVDDYGIELQGDGGGPNTRFDTAAAIGDPDLGWVGTGEIWIKGAGDGDNFFYQNSYAYIHPTIRNAWTNDAPDTGLLVTRVAAYGDFIAGSQSLDVTGCCPDCDECPPVYSFDADQYAWVKNGEANILLRSSASGFGGDYNDQRLDVWGKGSEFDVEMSLTFDMSPETTYVMSADGQNVEFTADGYTKQRRDDCEYGGDLVVHQWFEEDPCPDGPCD